MSRLARGVRPLRCDRWWGAAITLVLCLVAMDVLASPVAAFNNCPTGCKCDDDTLVVNCGDDTLDVLPITLNPSIRRLVIRNNRIKTIDSPIQFYADLVFLDISSNQLVTIPQRTFLYQSKLQELHLNDNRIGQISNRTFVGLASLTVLNLRSNALAELEYGTFSLMPKIEELNVGDNRISRIDPNAFDGLHSLRVLYLDDNKLTTVPSEATFHAMPTLAELFLGTNFFVTVPAGAFAALVGLTRLDLRGAGLYNVSAQALRGLDGLRLLDLSDNRLAAVPTDALGQLERLEQLSLGQNDFEVVAEGAFRGLKNLRRLQITGAQRLRHVCKSAFTTNTNLERLDLSSNKALSVIEAGALGGLPHLRHVVLKENQLATLAEGLFPWADLQTLDLSDNPLVCDCRVLWLRNLLVSKNASGDNVASVICQRPEHLRETPLRSLAPTALGCSHHGANQKTMIGVFIVCSVATVTALTITIYRCRRRIRDALKCSWGNSALGRKEREYQKTFSEEEYLARQQAPCSLAGLASLHANYANGYNGNANAGGGCVSSGSGSGNGSGNGNGSNNAAANINVNDLQYMGSRPIPVTEL